MVRSVLLFALAMVLSALMPSRCSTRSAFTFRMPDVPIPAPQIATIFTGGLDTPLRGYSTS